MYYEIDIIAAIYYRKISFSKMVQKCQHFCHLSLLLGSNYIYEVNAAICIDMNTYAYECVFGRVLKIRLLKDVTGSTFTIRWEVIQEIRVLPLVLDVFMKSEHKFHMGGCSTALPVVKKMESVEWTWYICMFPHAPMCISH